VKIGFANWFFGYVVIQVEGVGAAPFLNLAMQRGVEFYDINWLGPQMLEAGVRLSQVGVLRHVAKVTHCRFRVRRRQGRPFVQRYFRRQRYLLPVGFLLCLLGVYILSSFVFFVSVQSPEPLLHTQTEEIINLVYEKGLKPGGWTPGLDLAAIEKDILAENPQLAWVNIEKQGTKVEIMIVENTLPPEGLGGEQIVAGKAGVVEEILILSGKAVVSVGQTVLPNQVLVESENGKAAAIIRANVWYTGYGECSLQEEVHYSVGKAKKQISLLWPERGQLILWPSSLNTEENELKYTGEDEIYWWEGIASGLKISVSIYQKEIVNISEISRENAKEMALVLARQDARRQMPVTAKLVNESIYPLAEENGVIKTRVVWQSLEDIALSVNTD